MNETALVIIINNRYYYKHTKKRILTAWSLAGAKLFQNFNNLEVEKISAILKKRNKDHYIQTVKLG